MNEEAIKDAYNLFVSTGYNKSYEDFKALISSNPEALQDAYGLFTATGYNKDIESFKSLMGVGGAMPQEDVKKKDESIVEKAKGVLAGTTDLPSVVSSLDSSPSFLETVEQKPWDKNFVQRMYGNNVSGEYHPNEIYSIPTEDGGSASHKMASAEVDGKYIAFPTIVQKKGESGLTEMSVDEALNYALENNEFLSFSTPYKAQAYAEGEYKRGTVLEDVSRPDFFNKAINMITPDFIDNIEEVVVPKMNYQFGPMGFKFEESGATGDWMIATAPNGSKKEFSLDPAFGIGGEGTSNELKKWIKDNSPITGLEKLESEYTGANKRYTSEMEYRQDTYRINKELDDFQIAADTYFQEQGKVDKGLEEFNNLTVEQKQRPENIQKYQALIARGEELRVRRDGLEKKQEELKQNGKAYDASVGKYVIMQAEQGQDSGAFLNSFLEGAATMGGTFFTNLYGQVAGEASGLIYDPKEDTAKTLLLARRLGIEVPLELLEMTPLGNYIVKDKEAWNNWYNSLSESQKSDIKDKSKDQVKKDILYGTKGEIGMLEAARTGYTRTFGSGTTEAYKQKISEESFVKESLLGVTKSLPAMIAGGGVLGWTQRGFQLFSQSTDALFQEMEKNPAFKDVSENEKLAIAVPIALTEAALETYGFRNAIANKGLMNKLIMRVVGKAGKVTTARTFNELVKNEIESMGGRALLTLAGASLAEGETGLLQQVSEYAWKDIYNEAKKQGLIGDKVGEDMFNTPEFFSGEYFEAIGKSAAAEAIGGFVLGLPNSVSAAYTQKGYKGMSDVMFEGFERFSKDDKLQSAFVVDLKNKVNRGEMSPTEAKEVLNNYRNSVGLLRSLPPDLTLEGKKEAMNLLKEKRDLEQMKKGKDNALVKKIDARLEAINVELDALTDNQSTSAPAPTGTRRNRAQVLTEEEETRRTTLEEAIANANGMMPDGTTAVSVTVGDSILDMAKAQEELDALNAKIDEVLAAEEAANGPSVLATPESTTAALEGLSPEERTSTTFTQEDGTEVPVMGNESMLANLFQQVRGIAEENRTEWQQSVVDAVNVSLKTQLDEEAIQQAALQSGETVQPSQQTGTPVATVNGQKTELNEGFFKGLVPDKLYQFVAETIDQVPQAVRQLAKRVDIETRKKIIGLPIGKKGQKSYYTYTLTGDQIAPLQNEIVSSQAKQATTKDEIISNTVRSLISAFPDLVTKNFKSLSDMKAYVEAKYADSSISTQLFGGVGGMIIRDENDKALEILMNEEDSTETTLPHEAWHAILIRAFGENEALFKEFRDSIIKTLTDAGYTDIVDTLNEFSNTPEYQASNEQAQEWLVEFGGLLTASGITAENLDKKARNLLEQIKDIFNRIAKQITGQPLFLEDATADDILDFMVTISERMSKGQDISQFFREAEQRESAAPRRASLQVTAYHGSPFSFDKFTTEKMGSGEGNQAFGWGLYFTDLKDIARHYAKALTKSLPNFQGKTLNMLALEKKFGKNNIRSRTLNLLSDALKSVDGIATKEDLINYVKKNTIDTVDKERDEALSLIESYDAGNNKKNLYEVSLHEGKTPDQYTWLQWDKTLSENIVKKINAAVRSLGIDIIEKSKKIIVDSKGKEYKIDDNNPVNAAVHYLSMYDYGTIKEAIKNNDLLSGDLWFLETVKNNRKFLDALEQYKNETFKKIDNISGEALYRELSNKLGGQDKASLFLLENGIDGIKFPAESIARGTTSDTARGFNYVVFDENAVTIKNKTSFQKGGTLQKAEPKTSSLKDIDVKRIRTLSRAGSRVSKGLSVSSKDNQKVVQEAPDLSLEYVKENAPKVFIENANLLAKYSIVRAIKTFGTVKTIEQAQEVYDIFTRQTANNLKYLMDNFREDLKEIATLWYDGANILAQNFSKQYGITTEQAAGIIASLSPQKDWYQNVRLAEMVMMAFAENPVMTKEMIATQKAIIQKGLTEYTKDLNKAKLAYKKSRSKANAEALKKEMQSTKDYTEKTQIVLDSLSKLIGMDMNTAPDYAKPYYVRLFHEVNTTKDYDILSPDGKVIGVAKTKKKNTPNAKVAWGSYTEIGKATAIYLDGSQENITRTLGEMHKIRNFYNNIIDPMSADKDVTMDTHAVAAALMLPLSGKAKEVKANFGTGTSNSAPLGIKGLYYAFAEGYKLAAEETGLLPRQVQSITWEAVRGLFTDDFKRDSKKVAAINQIVDNYVNKKITVDEARNQITESAGGIKDPSWAGGPLQEGTSGNVQGETAGTGSGGPKSDTVGPKQRGPRVKVSKQKGNTLQEVQKIAQRYNMNNSGFSPAQVNEFAMSRELEPFGYSAKRAAPDANGRQRGVYILNPKGRFYNPFKAKFQRINLGAGNLGPNNVENIPGYARMLAIANGIIERSLLRGRTQAEIMENVMKYVKGSKVYEIADDTQREQLERNVETEFGKRQKSSPSVARLFGTIKDITKITMTEKSLLNKQFRDLARGARESKIAFMKAEAELAKQIKELVLSGQIKTKQVASIIRRFAALNVFNEDAVDKFVDYMTKVFEDANYDQKIQNARKKLTTAKKNIRSKIGIAEAAGPALIKLFNINPNLIPDSVLDKYIALVDSFGSSAAVLSIADATQVVDDVNEILTAIDEEVSLAEELAIRFDSFFDKVLDDDGKINFAETLIKMLEAKEITEDDVKLMKKYKNLIIPKVQKAPKTEAEIQAEKRRLINAIKRLAINVNALATRDERNDARELQSLLTTELLNQLSVSQLENIVKLIDNINNGYFPHYAELTIERLNSKLDKMPLTQSIKTGSALKIEKAYARIKKFITRSKQTATFKMLERGPLFNLEQQFGDFKTKNIFNSLFKRLSQGQAFFDSEMTTVNKTLDSARAKVASSYRNSPNAALFSSFKMMAYMLQLEYQSNPGSSQVQNVIKVINATIKHIDEGNTRFGDREVEMLQEILDKYSKVVGQDDSGKDIEEINAEELYDSFNSAEKDAIKVIQKLNEALREKAVYTAAVIRGDRINPLNNYIHHYVMHEYNADENATGVETSEIYNNAMRPSTRAQSLEERTKSVKPLNFDVFAATQRGAKYVMLDYSMTKAIRTARKTLNETKAELEKNGRIPKKEREIYNALNTAFEEVVRNVLTNNFISNSMGDEVVDFISKAGYRAILASVPRFISEYVSNMGTIIFDPASFARGVSLYGKLSAQQAIDIMKISKSVQVNRLFSGQSLSGKMIDTSILSQTTGIVSGSAQSDIQNVVNQIYNNTLKKYKNFIELTADTLISTPDKSVMRPYWFGVFANSFRKDTGKELDLDKLMVNDEAYVTENKEAIEKAAEVADRMSVRVGATDNPFMGILKGAVKPNQSSLTRGFNNFNNFMTRFAIYEYTTAREGIYAAMGQGMITRAQGVALLAGVTTRMTVYTLLTNILGSTMVGAFVDEEEPDNEKSFMQKFGQALASTATGLILGRNFGNATKGLVNYGVEEINKEFLTDLREGEYDPYEDYISYSYIPRPKEGQDISIRDLITNMMGSFGPAIKTTDLMVKKAFADEKKEADAIERSEYENMVRIPLEVLGNVGMIPLYKDVRKIVMADIYKDIDKASKEAEKKAAKEKASLHGYENREDLERYAPELYDLEFGKNSPHYEEEQARKKLKKEKDDLERKMKDEMYNYVPKEKKGFGSKKFGEGSKKKQGFGSSGGFGGKKFGQ